MASHLTVHISVLDLLNQEHRSQIHQILSQGSQARTFHQSDGAELDENVLLEALNAFTDESAAEDLSLDQLEALSGGVGLPEALVSSTILMAMVAGASGLFADSMGAMQNSRMQDALNAGVNANIEQVREDLAGYASSGNGEYNPTALSGSLGEDFVKTILDPTNSGGYDQDGDGNDDGIQTTVSIGGENVTRTVLWNGNSIEISYSHVGDDGTTTSMQGTSMVAPAAGWLP